MFVVSTFYKIFSLELTNAEILQRKIKKHMQDTGIKGTVLIGQNEGVNATISGARDAIDNFYAFCKDLSILGAIEYKESLCDFNPFDKIKVKIKKEIVTMRCDASFDFTGPKGVYIKPEEWDEFIARDDVVLLDTRNDYEYQIGTFEGAINPRIDNFRELPAWLEKNKDIYEGKKLATFCTGGIRCEKLTAQMVQCGNSQVYHLEGGILGYFEKTQNKNKKWIGDCFVFDNRIAVNDKLNPI